MARAKTYTQMNQFVGGLITEASPIAFPENAMVDGDNVDLSTRLELRRRLGVDAETDFTLSTDTVTDTELETLAIESFEWRAVGEDGELTFIVLQVGSTLYFYDASTEPLSDGLKSFTVDLDSHLAPGASTSEGRRVDMAFGRGRLFVAGPNTEPFYIEYDSAGDSISVSEITLEIRDFDGLDDGLAVDEHPVSLSSSHKYNLYNQGWDYVDGLGDVAIDKYKLKRGTYPSNSEQVHWGLRARGSPQIDWKFEPGMVETARYVTQQVPKGHYIVEAFNIDRSGVSGIAGLASETTASRPTTVCFFAGRVCWGGVDTSIYISEVLNKSVSNAGVCYQAADPTSDIVSELVASDGLVVPIPEVGQVVRMYSLGDSLLVLANNGVWSVSGAEGFKATNFTVSKIAGANAGAIGKGNVVIADGSPVWWSETGIYGISLEQISQKPQAANLSDLTVRSLYQDIPTANKGYAQGVYDQKNRRIIWLYKDTDTAPADSARQFYNKALVYDLTLKAFWTYTFEQLDSDTPFICGAVQTPLLTSATAAVGVTANGVPVVANGEPVVINEVELASGSSFLKFIMIKPNTGNTNNNWTFGEFNNGNFLDFETLDGAAVGADFTSYAITGYATQGDFIRFKSAPHVIVSFKRTETGLVNTGSSIDFLTPSGCSLDVRWDWTEDNNANRWHSLGAIYALDNVNFTNSGLTFEHSWPVINRKLPVKGSGRAISLKFTSETGKDFRIYGWAM